MNVDGERTMRSPERLPEVMKVNEVAEMLRVDRKTIYSMVERGQIPGVRRLGRCLRFSRRALVRWLDDVDAASNARRDQRAW